MKPGLPAKPTGLKLLQGTYRSDRATPNEVMPKAEIPPLPKHLSGEAREEWARVTQDLYAIGLLARADRVGLAAYCEAYAAWVQACKQWQLNKDSEDYKVFKGSFSVFKAASETMLRFLVEFGMTPASRTRISGLPRPEEGSKNPFENLG